MLLLPEFPALSQPGLSDSSDSVSFLAAYMLISLLRLLLRYIYYAAFHTSATSETATARASASIISRNNLPACTALVIESFSTRLDAIACAVCCTTCSPSKPFCNRAPIRGIVGLCRRFVSGQSWLEVRLY